METSTTSTDGVRAGLLLALNPGWSSSLGPSEPGVGPESWAALTWLSGNDVSGTPMGTCSLGVPAATGSVVYTF